MKKNSVANFFIFYIIYCELIYKISTNTFSLRNIFYPVLFAVATGLFIGFLCKLCGKIFGRIIAIFSSIIVLLPFMVQIVYTNWFKTAVTVQSAFVGTGKMLNSFGDMVITATMGKIVPVVLFVVPVILFIIFIGKFNFNKSTFKYNRKRLIASVIIYSVTLCTLLIGGKEPFSPYDLFVNVTSLDTAIARLGVTTATSVDIRRTIFGSYEVLTKENTVENIDYENANITNIDFNSLIENETDTRLISLHNYFNYKQPTYKNEYTGMFEGYNLVLLTCEGFSPMAINEELTPTLYKLANNGFIFNNFYTPIWGVSTSDGEYVANAGQYPKTGAWSFSQSSENDMMYCLGNVFSNLGYSTYAYHNHDNTYYNRNLSHPNMGYDFKAVGLGLEISNLWPESDLEMIETTVDEFINEDKFHAYYMTVSGHLEYNFTTNDMAIKNKALVEDLDMSEACKAYIACNIELDKALEHLIASLEEAGKLDNTVIALSADHYPYGLNNEQIAEFIGHTPEENFELYRNSFIIWNNKIEEPIVIEKNASSIDILPTLLNLFGVEYDSRLLAGTDILSDSQPLVAFSNGSFITDKVMYNATNGKITYLTNERVDEEYIINVSNTLVNKFRASAMVLDYDYYSIIKGAIQ